MEKFCFLEIIVKLLIEGISFEQCPDIGNGEMSYNDAGDDLSTINPSSHRLVYLKIMLIVVHRAAYKGEPYFVENMD
jgi:hypothetical protein